ncbi:putative quinol monooxygenase [Pseudaestuariivita sp.]|uniref:putative quinol monooxygenase n=1 Tax=Pseudaestuariivita sp. TaxID=2211669 RepID=UPI00405808EE
MSYVVAVTFTIHAGRMAEFLPLMRTNANASLREEPGCLQFDICVEGDEVFLYEVYVDVAAFAAHRETAHFLTFDAQVADLVAGKSVKTYAERYPAEG